MQKVEQKKNWILNSDAFQKFLEWLDEGTDSDGKKYLEMRQKLVNFFDRKNCSNPDELADETLNRVARRLQEEGKIETETPAKYCYVTARFVFMESLRDANNKQISIDEVLYNQIDKSSDEKHLSDQKEKMLRCLEECASKLESINRELIFRYYYGKEREKIENRRALAQELGLTINALTIRLCRIRGKLEDCVKKCAE